MKYVVQRNFRQFEMLQTAVASLVVTQFFFCFIVVVRLEIGLTCTHVYAFGVQFSNENSSILVETDENEMTQCYI